jgi:hypothetical protein
LTARRLVAIIASINLGNVIGEFRLQCHRVDSIGMETFIDNPGNLHEVFDGILGYNDMHGREGLLLIQAPDVQFVDGCDTLDLVIVSIEYISKMEYSSMSVTFSRSCFTSHMFTPLGALSSRIKPALRT